MKNSQKRLQKKLHQIIAEQGKSIRTEVAKEALNHSYDDLTNFFQDVLMHGCISGMIGSLIYYSDTHTFFDTHYDEIEKLREEYEEDFGQPFQIQGDLKNFYAWFAFEEIARQLANELELEV